MVDLPSNIMDLWDEDEYHNILIYADSGVGKTVLAGSDEDVLFVAPEDNGTLSAKRFGSQAKKWKINEGAQGWDDIVKAYDWLYSLEKIPFNWVVLDSLTEMQSMCMRKVLSEALEINPSRDPDLPLIGDWQPYYNRFERLIKAFNALPVNILYTALQMEEENEDGENIVLPMLQGKGTQYSKKVCGWMTAFGNMRVKRLKTGEKDEEGKEKYAEYRAIQWRATPTVMAKDRTRCLEPRTLVGEGKLDGLKGIRELLETGPQQPAAGRIAQKPAGESKLKRRPNPANTPDDAADIADSVPQHLMDDDEDSEETQVNLMGV